MLHLLPESLIDPVVRVIATFTDFSMHGPYLGQVRAVLQEMVPGVPVVDIFPDMPACNVKAAAYLLPAYIQVLAKGSICLCVVDPGVGTSRRALVLEINGIWYVGPDNGLFSLLVRRAEKFKAYEINWRPKSLSNSFHGRDLFAPVCGMLAGKRDVLEFADPLGVNDLVTPAWPEDLFEIIYIDSYGNLVTGLRAAGISEEVQFEAAGQLCSYQRVFADAGDNRAFWYENANGLVEIAVRGGNAADTLGMDVGGSLYLAA